LFLCYFIVLDPPDEPNREGLGTHLFVKVPWPLTRRQQIDLFGLLSQAVNCYYQSNHSKVEAILLRALPRTQLVNLPAYLHTIPF